MVFVPKSIPLPTGKKNKSVAIVETEPFSLGFLLCVVLGTYFSSSARTANWSTCRRPWSAPTLTGPSFQMCLDILADNLDVPQQE